MAFRVASDINFDDRSPADQFQRYARAATTYLVIGSLVAIALGLLLGAVNVWDQHDRFSGFGDGAGFRFYVLNFFSLFAAYGGIAAMLFATGMVISSLAWFQLSLAADFDDLYESTNGDDDSDPDDPQTDTASDWARPVGTS